MVMKQKVTVYALLSIFSIYFISVIIESNILGNILSPLVAFMSAFLILKSLKRIENYKICWFFIFLCPLIWGIADLFWLIYDNILLIDPINIDFVNIIYTFPNLFLVMFMTVYYAYNFKKWNLYQLIIDVVAISSMMAIMLWSFIFSKTGFEFHSDIEYINIIVYIFLDFYLLCGIGVIYISKGLKNINKSFYFVISGIIVCTFTDYFYSYLYLINSYKANTLIDGIYMSSNVLFALGAHYNTYYTALKQPKENINFPENIRKPKKSVFAFTILFYFLYLIKVFSFREFMISVIICILYWILTTHVQAGMRNKFLLKTELEINEQLEKIVAERTKELTETNKYLEEISNKDPLTGLYNRRYLINYLDSLINNQQNNKFALLYIDANRFKAINDSYGHEIGDKVLCVLGKRFLDNCISNCTAFRIGGDEFAVLIKDYPDKEYINEISEKILNIIQQSISIPPYFFTITASIGIALYPYDTKNRDLLMRYADIAMYEVKNKYNKNNYLFFTSALSEKSERKHEIEFHLKNADYNKEFVLYYQPQYSTKDKSVTGMEALIRWRHPEKGFIYPSEFIPIAEESGAIIDIGEWVIDRAFSQIKKWNETYNTNLKMSINVSPIQIENTNFITWLKDKIKKDNILPDWIDLEVTEGSAMNPNISFEEIFNLLEDIGINTSIDDFGTGYSSLSYIKRFNINRLKIAKELIDNIGEDKNALLIVQAIIMMAKGMGLKTIAEGVENIDQLKILEKLECDEIQGYIFGKPVSAKEFEHLHIKQLSNFNF